MPEAIITLHAPPEQRDLVDYAAKLLGVEQADFILEAACERAQVVVLDHVFFTLDRTSFDTFRAMLAAPLEPNAGLERLLALQTPWKDSAP